MINKMRWKFILVAMLSVFVVLAMLICVMNYVNYSISSSKWDETIGMIEGNRGSLPEYPYIGIRDTGRGMRFSIETPFTTRYFVLYYSDDGMLLGGNFRHIAAVSEENMAAYFDEVKNSTKPRGYVDTYRYSITRNDYYGYNMAVFLDVSEDMYAINRLLRSSLIIGGIFLAAVFILIWLLSKPVIVPVARNMQKQKRFITDASHELKTPLTVISTSLSVLEMDVGKQKWIDKAQAQIEKMRDLVNELVTLARLDEVGSRARSDFDISSAVTEVAESFRDAASAKGFSMRCEITPNMHYKGDELSVRRLVSVLLDNALKYTDEGGQIGVSMAKEQKYTVIRVRNTCRSFDKAELEHIFDRFYRVDKARSSDGGFGIGLSIAQSIAEAHNGKIKASCPDSETVEFTVKLR